MRYKPLIILIAITTWFSCRKDAGMETSSKQVDELELKPTVLLKDVVLSSLPSPFYHFVYNAAGKASFISYASDLTRYNVIYEGGRIIEMRNNILVNKDRLQYLYDNDGRVKAVKY